MKYSVAYIKAILDRPVWGHRNTNPFKMIFVWEGERSIERLRQIEAGRLLQSRCVAGKSLLWLNCLRSESANHFVWRAGIMFFIPLRLGLRIGSTLSIN